MKTWQVSGARSRFSTFVNAVLREGPQVVIRNGAEVAVQVSIERWRRMERTSRPDVKELLLSGPRFDNIVSSRRKLKRRRSAISSVWE